PAGEPTTTFCALAGGTAAKDERRRNRRRFIVRDRESRLRSFVRREAEDLVAAVIIDAAGGHGQNAAGGAVPFVDGGIGFAGGGGFGGAALIFVAPDAGTVEAGVGV